MDVEIRSPSGDLIFSQKNVKAPTEWSQTAVEIAASKYFRKIRGRREASVQSMVDRVVFAIMKSGKAQGYFDQKKGLAFAKKLRAILLSQKAAFNSPVWFNCGLSEKGEKAEGTAYAWDPRKKRILAFADAYVHPQISACFIQSVDDSIEGIFQLALDEAKLFKFGSGSGTNFSTLRSKYEEIGNGGTSSGLLSFLEVLDRGAGAIKSGGTTRRAAKMNVVDADHPEILEFIKWKAKEENKAQILISGGLDPGFEGEAYKTVSGQNANNSVRLTDKFFQILGAGGDWSLRDRMSGRVRQKLPAAQLWREVCQAAWHCADPGLQFHDQINAWNTCSVSGPIRASNPCSEFMFLDNSACNLASLNLVKFLDKDGCFLSEEFQDCVEVILTAQDILVDYGGYPTQKIAQNSHDFRPLGLGFANLGGFLMAKGLAYGSDEARNWAGTLSAILTGKAYLVSASLATRKGPFAAFAKNKKSVFQVLKQHHQASEQLRPHGDCLAPLVLQAQELWKQVLSSAKKSGLRNSQVSTIAPTGTIGLLMDCDTTGIEPEFSLVKVKNMAGGSRKYSENQIFRRYLQRTRSAAEIQEILKTVQLSGSLQNTPGITAKEMEIFACASEISPENHLLMMAAVQPFISGAISKTINMPMNATPEQIGEVYLRAWELGLKSVAIYREGSKGAAPLTKGSGFEKCPLCQSPTRLEAGCYRCTNCGHSLGCA